MDKDYARFLASKAVRAPMRGLKQVPELAAHLFNYQAHSVAHALQAGGAGLFLDTGLGKTECQLEFLRHGGEATNGRTLLLTPLAVAGQTKRRAERWGYEARVIRDQSEAGEGINIVNYDRLDKIDPSWFGAVSLDEASILKSFTGKTTRALIEAFRRHRFKLAATATPAPNDHMELGQYAEFTGAMRSNEMLMRWFITDQTEMGRYRIKGHAEADFWDWLASWARCAELPSDLGGDDTGFILPEIAIFRHRAAESAVKGGEGLFASVAMSATNMHAVKRQTSAARADAIAGVVAREAGEAWLIWCDTDYEADALKAAIPSAIEVRGSHTTEQKEDRLEAFATGQAKHLIAKPQMCGFGLDWSHCARMAFVGRSYSYETFYQAVRRCQRFGQKRQVQVHIAVAEGEAEIGRIVERKTADHAKMKIAMRAAMARAKDRRESVRKPYDPKYKGRLPTWLKSAA
jgi:superfamily II DNA or RNA helicase